MRASEPGYIGSVRIRNRIVMAPMISNLATPEHNHGGHMAYLEARARGGAGLIITEYTYINDANARGGSPNQLAAYSYERVPPKLRRLTERIHRHGAKAFMQIVHAGGKANADINRKENFAPTAMEYLAGR
ncbi:hypothetical protein [Thermogymnomonas acidicola]|uniref:oxidoreductase n=1 Tax=Thermogymnomonas acidicola TaxID=399579 RepID=UPI0013968FD4|nr:hypothetical protein [Thermogymnomonas acidicola]